MKPTILLHENEKMLLEVDPKKRLGLYIMLTKTPHYITLIFSIAFVVLTQSIGHINFTESGITNALIHYTVFAIIILGVLLLISYLWCKGLASKHHYFFTNQRCILYWGFWGISQKVIPYNRIADVGMRQNPLRSLLGITAVFIDEQSTMNAVDGLSMEDANQILHVVSEHISK